MRARELELPDVYEITLDSHIDERGSFAETFRDDWFRREIAPYSFVQENQSFSAHTGTLRGLHYQRAPMAQGKLVRCLAGAIFDVAVDIRPHSPAYGKWIGLRLTQKAANQLWIPPGFLHGFCTLEPDTVVSYRVTRYYSAAHDAGVQWDDPDIGVSWPDLADPASLSPKDRQQPGFRALRASQQFHMEVS